GDCAVAGASAVAEDRFREAAAESGAGIRVADVQALHLACVLRSLPESHAPGRRLPVEGEEKAARRRRVLAGELGKLTVEALEREVDAELVRVVTEELARELEVSRFDRLLDPRRGHPARP